MPIPIELEGSLHKARNLIEQDEYAEAAQFVDNVWAWADRNWDVLNDIESMEFLGQLAFALNALKRHQPEIRVLERLCSIADRDLDSLGIMATDDDIRWTGEDFIKLGLAYVTIGKRDDARAAL